MASSKLNTRWHCFDNFIPLFLSFVFIFCFDRRLHMLLLLQNRLYLSHPALLQNKKRTELLQLYAFGLSNLTSLYARNSHKGEIHCLPTVRRSILWFAGTYGIFSTFAEDSLCSVYPPPVYFCQFILRGIPFWHWFIFIVFLFADFMPFFFIRMMV